MLKSEVIIDDGVRYKFPLLARLKAAKNLVVLFHAETSGTVVAVGNHSEPIGSYSSNWNNVLTSRCWEILRPGDQVIIKVH